MPVTILIVAKLTLGAGTSVVFILYQMLSFCASLHEKLAGTKLFYIRGGLANVKLGGALRESSVQCKD